jgi:hypothetical protein
MKAIPVILATRSARGRQVQVLVCNSRKYTGYRLTVDNLFPGEVARSGSNNIQLATRTDSTARSKASAATANWR